MIQKTDLPSHERRKYVRIDSIFPVQFRLLSCDGRCFLSDWIQGFTNNVSSGGVCLEVNNLKAEFQGPVLDKGAKLYLSMDLPFNQCPVNVTTSIVWAKKITAVPNKFIIGLSYENISPAQKRRIIRFAWGKKLFAPVAVSAVVALAVAFASGSYLNMKLTKENRALVNQLVAVVEDAGIAKQKMMKINKEKEALEINIRSLSKKLTEAEGALEKLSATSLEAGELSLRIEKLVKEKAEFQEKLAALQNTEAGVKDELARLGQKQSALEKANFDKMYQWLKVHQSPRTGLVASFEGDKNIANWAFTYDEALAVLAYSYFSDFQRAKKILDFFKTRAEKINGQFVNAYYAGDGNPAEYTVHNGPNIWLGIAIMHYTKMSGDTSYMKLAEEIAAQVIKIQNDDADGGIRGGPEVNWYATEHNLDAYAFFNMLYTVTSGAQYKTARDKVLKWLVMHTYGKAEVPIKRGKGDSTIATDTYAWSIAAIGPEKLEELGMNPERIMEFAQENCYKEVEFRRPEGRSVKVKGFDFAPERHVARGGVVSTEWTAQMILSMRIMGDYYQKKGMDSKARSYELKADDYLASLANMVISSPSPSGQGESCLPYATQDFVDTGHGWMTPAGKSTGSVSGTAYTLFAYYRFNPLEL